MIHEEVKKIPSPPKKPFQRRFLVFFVLIVFTSSLFGFLSGSLSVAYFYAQIKNYLEDRGVDFPSIIEQTTIEREIVEEGYLAQEKAVINVVEKYSPAVVSIVITKDVPILERYLEDPFEGMLPFEFDFGIPQYKEKGTEKREVGGGTGFIVSEDGFVLTNKHVVADGDAEYTIFTVDGKRFSAEILARDPFQDLAVLKIKQEQVINGEGTTVLKPFPVATLGDSDALKMGQTVIVIGNALGEFRNTVSKGVISGLGRTITASGGGVIEVLEDVIQTDAAINRGNSGGPLLNLKGEVIGISTAMVVDAQSIGFAIPINKAKRAIDQVKKFGKIVYPFLGVRYVVIDSATQEENNLPVDYGAWVIKGDLGEEAVFPGSSAQKSGILEGDIILEFDKEKITTDNSLAKIIVKYNPGDRVNLKVLRNSQELNVDVILGERSE